jgi:hypothetical protein
MEELKFERVDYSVVDTGKAIRRALREAFPGVKFSLRGSRGTGYGWFSLGWTDGPTDDQVRALTFGFQSSYFDGMDDGNHSIPATMYADPDGVIREHRYSCRGVNGSRNYSPAAEAWADAYIDAHGGPEIFAPEYANATHHDARWRVLQYIDLTGVELETLPTPARGFTGRHVPDSYCLETGRMMPREDEGGKHRAEVAA